MAGHEFGAHLEGAVFLTDSKPLSERFISLEDVLQLSAGKSTVQYALLTTFCLDHEWLMPKLWASKIPTNIVINPPNEEKRPPDAWKWPERISLGPGVSMQYAPFMPRSYGVFHAKIMLVVFEGKGVRFALSSANLMQCDFEIYENNIFVQDFPFLPKDQADLQVEEFEDEDRKMPTHAKQQLRTLLWFLKKSGVDTEYDIACSKARCCDWSRFQPSIVCSVPGVDDTGIPMLREILEAQMPQYDTIECQCSSLGQMMRDWVRRFGVEPNKVRIVFPSKAHIDQCADRSIYGNIRYRAVYWEDDCQLQASFYDCVSERGYEKPLHSKTIVFSMSGEDRFVYMGSHNFTPAAWGRWTTTTRTSRLIVSNYEIGLIIDLLPPKGATKPALDFPFAYRRDPLVKYAKGDRPWCQ